MSARLSRALAASIVGIVVAAGMTAPADAAGNPTGTAAGSPPNGSGYLKMSLQNTSDGRILVTWVRPRNVAQLSRFVIRVGMNWGMDSKVRVYRVSRARSSAIVPHGFGVSQRSGNYSFVKLIAKKKVGHSGGTRTKWIQAPLAAGCDTSGPKVTVGTFNVRTWEADLRGSTRRFNWNKRGPRVIRTILRSNAGAVVIQEASGRGGKGFGSLRQHRWILSRLNAADPAANWVDALSDNAYPSRGLVGTRVIYDSTRYDKLAAGLRSLGGSIPALAAWARLRPRNGGSAPFVLVSTHLTNGNAGRIVKLRGVQARRLVDVANSLRNAFGNQVIVGGDLNSTVNTKPYNNVHQILLHAGFYDGFATARLSGSRFGTTHQYKFPVRPSPYRRDYLLSLGDMSGSCGYRNMYYRYATQVSSDHFMQVATLPLPGP